MLPIALNHMTVPHATTRALLDMAAKLGCTGVELRNDLDRSLFDGAEPAEIQMLCQTKGLRLLGIAELKAFNHDTDDKLQAAETFVSTARRAGAEGIALIPAVANEPVSRSEQRRLLRTALVLLQPILEKHQMIGLIEPLGFANSTLRFKADVDQVLTKIRSAQCFALVHDTFHHHLAGEAAFFARRTAIVHVSGVIADDLTPDQMTDAHRVLVDDKDRLGNLDQLRALRSAGYAGPVSFEAFAPEIHDMKDPVTTLAGSIAFINDGLADVTAGAA